jgi:hypothetical protein
VKFPADVTFDTDLKGCLNVIRWLEKEVAMSSILKSRLGRMSTAVALAAVGGVLVTSTADAQPWRYRHYGYYNNNPAWALNTFAGALAGAAVASTYYNPYPYRYYYPAPAYYPPPPAYGYYNPYYGPEPTYGLVVR